MAVSLSAAPPVLQDLLFLRPSAGRLSPLPLLRYYPLHSRRRFRRLPSRVVLRSAYDEEVAVTEVSPELDRYVGNGNGGARFGYKEVVNGSTNGSVELFLNGNGSTNGGLMKYSGENATVAEDVDKVSEEAKRKKRVEDIGKEDAWFNKDGEQPQVSVAPGGRWNRFRTYSTIQRTLEIWGSMNMFTPAHLCLEFKFYGITRNLNAAKPYPCAKQDQVPPFPSETAVSIVEEELGAPLDGIFDRFDYEPIAAASLGNQFPSNKARNMHMYKKVVRKYLVNCIFVLAGQVHRARLKGQEVVIKVQRPDLKELFDIDLKNLRVIAEYLQKVDPKSDGAKRDWVAIYDECAGVLYQEIDYMKEAANAEKFAENFTNMEYVKVPKIYWEYTTPQVLTMEYVPGVKINRIKQLDQLGVDRKRLGRYAVESYLEQILSHGFFHADPHPGNIAVDDVNGGRLIFYDFGMMGSISSNIREGLLEAFYGIYDKDPDRVLQAMIQMGVLVPTGDMTAVRRTAQFFLNSFEERLAAQRKEREMASAELGFKKQLTKEERLEKKKQRLAAIGEDLLAIAADQPFRFPATFTFVVRAFSVLDGIGKGLDPRFDITEIAKPYALELLRFREAGLEVIVKDIKKRWERQSSAFYNLFRQADRVEKLAQTIQRLELGDLKLRVRTLESERAFQRVAAVQKTIGNAVALGSLVNLATILYFNSVRVPAMAAYLLCAFFGAQVLFGFLKVKKLDQQERLITGTA
ncbi:hypothetical protein C4D60_Mb06t35900 [Musa balbisiana]|uniref:ABC1 atypical kinase-like domain-containing protein n=1 Tax=Musa balbisiana TaxID=52838 RepID=A0A4V6T460_MUSBA|nr:hypothetical protein C4D60_Mb06t35900 [Musa balbisiana]